MNTHIPTHSIAELRTWLPAFQEELIADFHADDGTRRPRYYTHWSPDLEKLLELIYALDLEKTKFVFKTL